MADRRAEGVELDPEPQPVIADDDDHTLIGEPIGVETGEDIRRQPVRCLRETRDLRGGRFGVATSRCPPGKVTEIGRNGDERLFAAPFGVENRRVRQRQ